MLMLMLLNKHNLSEMTNMTCTTKTMPNLEALFLIRNCDLIGMNQSLSGGMIWY